MQYRVYDIEYDTDGKKVEGLPEELFFDADGIEDPAEELADLVSDKTGWCIFGHQFEEVPSIFPAPR